MRLVLHSALLSLVLPMSFDAGTVRADVADPFATLGVPEVSGESGLVASDPMRTPTPAATVRLETGQRAHARASRSRLAAVFLQFRP